MYKEIVQKDHCVLLFQVFMVSQRQVHLNTMKFHRHEQWLNTEETKVGNVFCYFLLENLWTTAQQNLQNDMYSQERHRSACTCTQSDHSLRCPHKEVSSPWLSLQHTEKILIRLGPSPGWSVSSLGAHAICRFCYIPVHIKCLPVVHSEIKLTRSCLKESSNLWRDSGNASQYAEKTAWARQPGYAWKQSHENEFIRGSPFNSF